MKIIFLDFDGVLNTTKSWLNEQMEHRFDREKVTLLSDFVEEIDAHIVISSAWREYHTLGELRAFLSQRGFRNVRKRVIGKTPVYEDMRHRGKEIQHWLRLHPHVESFVILDDNDWMDGVRHRFVQTSMSEGLTVHTIARARAHLEQAA